MLASWVPWCVAVGRVALAGSAILGAPMVRLQESCSCDSCCRCSPPSAAMTMPQRWMIRVVAAVCCCWLPGWVPWCVAVGRVALAGSAILGAPMVRLQESCYCNDMLLVVAPPSTILTMPSHYLASLSWLFLFFLPVVFVVVFCCCCCCCCCCCSSSSCSGCPCWCCCWCCDCCCCVAGASPLAAGLLVGFPGASLSVGSPWLARQSSVPRWFACRSPAIAISAVDAFLGDPACDSCHCQVSSAVW